MKDEMILKLAIEKAVGNGWDTTDYRFYIGSIVSDIDDIAKYYTKGEKTILYYTIIFTHDFAKAFWGEQKYRYEMLGFPHSRELTKEEFDEYEKEDKWQGQKKLKDGYDWKYYLQQMVLEPEPLKYLEQFLNQD